MTRQETVRTMIGPLGDGRYWWKAIWPNGGQALGDSDSWRGAVNALARILRESPPVT